MLPFAGNATDSLQGVWEFSNNQWVRILAPIDDNDNTTSLEDGLILNKSSLGRIELALAPSNKSILYVLYRNQFNEFVQGDIGPDSPVFLLKRNLSTNKGINFDMVLEGFSNSLQFANSYFNTNGAYNMSLSVHPTNPDFVILGGSNLYRISNTSSLETFRQTYQRIGGTQSIDTFSFYQNGGDAHHPNIKRGLFSTFNSTTFLTASDGGIHITKNFNLEDVTWKNLNNNTQTINFINVALDPVTDDFYGSTYQNGLLLTDSSTSTDPNDITQLNLNNIGFRLYRSRFNPQTPQLFATFIHLDLQLGILGRKKLQLHQIIPKNHMFQINL